MGPLWLCLEYELLCECLIPLRIHTSIRRSILVRKLQAIAAPLNGGSHQQTPHFQAIFNFIFYIIFWYHAVEHLDQAPTIYCYCKNSNQWPNRIHRPYHRSPWLALRVRESISAHLRSRFRIVTRVRNAMLKYAFFCGYWQIAIANCNEQNSFANKREPKGGTCSSCCGMTDFLRYSYSWLSPLTQSAMWWVLVSRNSHVTLHSHPTASGSVWGIVWIGDTEIQFR